ncbi:IS1182 family transposase [Ferrimicrobium sp.]|uniref:IS1182 family transposase n=1 Tax=Ferrimicrobium sp. TaxID=2926050 RepID=UPI002601A38D|nr:IS1182 family transposase [Ferrimicrobium sp.]
MSLGIADSQSNFFDDMAQFCEKTLPKDSIYAFLHDERNRLFPDEAFADLFSGRGRQSVPPSVIATVMVLQRLEGCSDREATERYAFDARWRYAAGVGSYDVSAWPVFSHTVLVDFRERLRRSDKPDRVFEISLQAARAAGLVGRKRVLDSTPLYDAVATMDTITLIRSAIRNLLKVADRSLRDSLVRVLTSGDDYASSAKPTIDWDDRDAQAELIDSRAKDAYACLVVLEAKELTPEVNQAAHLLATVVGQDLEQDDDGSFHIARRVAKDRIISTVDPEARHGHKTTHHKFDGYKGHIAIDPDSEIITSTIVTPGNAGDASAAQDLIGDLLEDQGSVESDDLIVGADLANRSDPTEDVDEIDRPTVYGDNAYGTGSFHDRLEQAGIDSRCKTQDPAGELFTKDRFDINLTDDTVTCPAGVRVAISRNRSGGVAKFADACTPCQMSHQCTSATQGRTISINSHEAALTRARNSQRDPVWHDDYRATRPKVERKFAHLMRRKHGGRRARVRGLLRVGNDFSLLAGAANLARMAKLQARSNPCGGWEVVM